MSRFTLLLWSTEHARWRLRGCGSGVRAPRTLSLRRPPVLHPTRIARMEAGPECKCYINRNAVSIERQLASHGVHAGVPQPTYQARERRSSRRLLRPLFTFKTLSFGKPWVRPSPGANRRTLESTVLLLLFNTVYVT